jgi:hypothetical protein
MLREGKVFLHLSPFSTSVFILRGTANISSLYMSLGYLNVSVSVHLSREKSAELVYMLVYAEADLM